jgi:hypothetical protein
LPDASSGDNDNCICNEDYSFYSGDVFFTGSENDTDDENIQKFLEAKFEFWHCPKQCQ